MIRSLLSLFAVSMIGTSAFAVSVGFADGNQFNSATIRGTLSLTCYDRFGNRQYQELYCEEETLDPVEMSYLTTSEPIDADGVTLSATRKDGSMRMKTQGYDASKMRSTKRFNLWVSSLLQKPLLDVGVNRIEYNFVKNDATVASGTFDATVTRGPMRTCPHGVEMNGQSCDIDYCAHYFEDNNYCE
jgi:hypothetical protein